MTDNEKAATFIGWKPGMVHRAVSMGITTVSVPCDADDPRAHPLEAPDMSRPENYMKAAREVYRMLFVEDDARLTAFQRSGLMDIIETVLYEDAPTSLIAWLAGFYDAEHPEAQVGRCAGN